MLSQEQKKWLDHLNDSDKVNIIPYNPKSKDIFTGVKKDLTDIFGKIRISHRGSTSLKISGQGEIDLYIPVSKKDFNRYLEKLTEHLGSPGSIYPLERARFVKFVNNIKIEIFLINKNGSDWKKGIIFEKYLKLNPDMLDKYEKLKTKMQGKSTKEYYTAKLIFMNKILKLASRNP